MREERTHFYDGFGVGPSVSIQLIHESISSIAGDVHHAANAKMTKLPQVPSLPEVLSRWPECPSAPSYNSHL